MPPVAHKLTQKVTSDYKHPPQSESIKRALVSLGLEGISLSNESLTVLQLFAVGKISKKDALKRVVTRVKSQTR